MQKRTKIVCTIGPASCEEEVLRSMITMGADVFRLNFSHGTHADHQHTINLIHHISRDLNKPFAILGDLSGPKLRVGEITGGGAELLESEIITLTSEETNGAEKRFQVNIEGFHEVADVGQKVMLDDGALHLVVEGIDETEVRCRVITGGILRSHKGVNLPDTKLPIPALTEKDRRDITFALRYGVDLLALSFVRDVEDIRIAKRYMKECGRVVPILAKIEKKEAIDDLEAIVREADGAMVARGDLGIEIPMEEVPSAQKKIIRLCNKAAKPVITATQMLESMIKSPRPTRAEVTDVYNAIFDGTDAVMLSGETAMGNHPVKAVEVMNIVAMQAESNLVWNKDLDWVLGPEEAPSTAHLICHSAVNIAEKLGVDLIIVPTQTGFTARHVSQYRPTIPIFAVSPDHDIIERLCLSWGVTPRPIPDLIEEEVRRSESDALVNEAIRTAKRYGFARSGNRAVILGGLPLGESFVTNHLRVIEIP